MRCKFCHTPGSIFSMSLVSVFVCLTCDCSQLIYAIRCFSSSTVEVQRKIDQRSSLARKPLVPRPLQSARRSTQNYPMISIRFSWNKLPHAFHMVLICSLKSGFATLGFQWDLTEHQIKLSYVFLYEISWLKMSLSFRLEPSGITELSFHVVYIWYEIIENPPSFPL